MRIPRTLALVLAGGTGSRMACLTDDRPKPVLPVGGTYRLIDVALSNLAHSHITDVGLVQQYLPRRLNDYLSGGRPWDLDRSHGGLHLLPPFEGGEGAGFAQGNADAIHRQADFIRAQDPELVLVLSADHLYTMDFLQVLSTHLDADADLTIVTTAIGGDPGRYGVVEADDRGRVTSFVYKPSADDLPPTAGGGAPTTVATEVFVYSAPVLLEALDLLAREHGQLDDYGDQLVPWFVANRLVVEHRHGGYWLDLGTLQSYWTANLQLLDGDGATLDDPSWPIWSAQPQLPPARVRGGASITDAWLASGADVAGEVVHSVVGTRAVVDAGATVVDSVLLDGVRIGAGVTLTNCIVDVGAQVSGGSVRGSADTVTVIAGDGRVHTREPLDPGAALPSLLAGGITKESS